MTSKEPTLFVVDDDEAVLDAVATMARTVDVQVQVFVSAEEFLQQYVDMPGCLLLDIRMPLMSGLDLQELLPKRGIDVPVIIITGHPDVRLAVRAVKAGAVDFLEKPFREQELLDHIHRAFQLDEEQRRQRIRYEDFSERYSSLTPREKEVMGLLVEGNGGKEIAARLKISYKTVEKFRSKVMRKMKAGNVAELVLMAVSLGLVSSNRPLGHSAPDRKSIA